MMTLDINNIKWEKPFGNIKDSEGTEEQNTHEIKWVKSDFTTPLKTEIQTDYVPSFLKPEVNPIPQDLKDAPEEGIPTTNPPSYINKVTDVNEVLQLQGDSGFETSVAADKGKLAYSLQAFKDVDPDTAAKAQKIADSNGVLIDLIYNDRLTWFEYEKAVDVINKLYEKDDQGNHKYPRVVGWLQNPQNMAMAKDDIQALREIEELLTTYKGSFIDKKFRDVKEGTKGAVKTSLDILKWLAEAPVDTQKEIKDLKYSPEGQMLPSLLQETLANQPAFLDKVLKAKNAEWLMPVTYKPDSWFDQFTSDVMRMLPQVAGTIGASAIGTPVAGAGFMFGQIFGSKYGELRDEGVTPDRASTAAFADATLQAVPAYIGISKLMKLFKTTGIANIGKEFITTILTEGGTEALQQFPDEATRIWGEAQKNGQTPEEQISLFFDRLPQTAKEGLYQGLVVMPFAVLGGATALVKDTNRYLKYGTDKRAYETLEQVTASSKLASRSPEKFEEVVNHTLGDPVVYVPLNALKTYYQADPDKLRELIAKLGVHDQIEDAEITDVELAIPTAKWLLATKADPVLGENIKNNGLRFSLESMTAKERQDYVSDLESKVSALETEYKEKLRDNRLPKAIIEYRNKLMTPKEDGGAGMKAEDADANTQLLLAGAKHFAKEWGVSVEDWFKKVNPVLNIDNNIGVNLPLAQQDVTYNQSGHNPETLTASQWTKISSILKAKGYDSRGGEDVKARYQKAIDRGVDMFETQADWKDAFSTVLGVAKAALSEQEKPTDKINTKRVKELGVTTYFPHAGYIRPDGKLIDLSGVREGAQYGARSLDHREVGYGDTSGMLQFMNLGNIRMFPETGGFDLLTLPNKKQEAILTRWIDTYNSDDIYVDLQEGLSTEGITPRSVSLKFNQGIKSSKVLGIIRRFFNGENFESNQEFFQSAPKPAWQTPKSEFVKKPYNVDSFFDTKSKFSENDKDRIDIFKIIRQRGGIRPNEDFNVKLAREDGLGSILNKKGRPLDEWVAMLRDDGFDFQDSNELWEYLLDPSKRIINSQKFIEAQAEESLRQEYAKYLKDAFDIGLTEEDIQAGFTPEYVQGIVSEIDSIVKNMNASESEIETFKIDTLKNTRTKLLTTFRELKHKESVERALQADKQVPLNVLKDYPDLASKYKIDLTKEPVKPQEEYIPGMPLIARGSIELTDSATIITLFKNANMSTLLHEFGHIFIDQTFKLVDAGMASEQTLKDYNTMLTFADGKFDRDGIEKLARAFEAYLREGNAPSMDLKNAFRKFKAWLMNIYKSIKKLNVEINDDIRHVFDRMLASEQEIEDAKEYYGFKKDISNLIPNISPKEKLRLKDKKKETEEEAFERQVKKYLNEFVMGVGGKQAIIDDAKRQIESEPVYKVMDDVISNKGFNYQNTVVNYGVKAVNALKSKHSKSVSKTATNTIAEYALKYGFESPDALVKQLSESLPKQEAIKQRVNEILKSHEDNIRTDLQAGTGLAGDEAIHNDRSLEYLIAQLEILESRIAALENRKAVSMAASVFKEVAEDMLANKPINLATRYDIYAKTEVRYDKEAYKALEKNDLKTAHEAKKKQILNHAMVQAAIRARDFKQDFANRYSSSKLKSTLKSVENDCAQAVSDLVYTFILTGNESIKPKTEIKISDIDEVLASQVPSWILNKEKPEGFKDWRDLTLRQVQELNDTLSSIIHFGKGELKSIKEAKYKTVQDIVDASILSADSVKDKRVFDENSPAKRKLDATVSGLLSELKAVEFEFERLDGYSLTNNKSEGPLRILFSKGRDCETSYILKKQKVLNALIPSLDTLMNAKKRIEERFGGKYFRVPELPINERMEKLGRLWSAERLIAITLNMGNDSNLQAILNGYGYSKEQVTNVINGLFTAEELNAVQEVWNTIDTLFPELDKTHFNIYNRRLSKIDARDITLNDISGNPVTLKGGYYPLIFDHMLNDVAAKNREEDLLKNHTQALLRTSKPSDGMTFSRVDKHSLPPDLSLSVLFRHIADTARYITHAEYLKDVNRLTLNEDWREMVRQKAGRPAYDKIRDWVKHQARPDQSLIMNNWERVLESLRNKATVVILGGKALTAIKQREGVFKAASTIGWDNILKATLQFGFKGNLGLSNAEIWKSIESKSNMMKTRFASIDRDLRDALNNFDPIGNKKFSIGGREFTKHDITEFFFQWILMNDRATTGSVWLGAYNKYLADNNSADIKALETEAIKYADNVVSMTQATALPLDLTALQRKDTMNGASKLFTMFMTESLKAGNRIMFHNKAYWVDKSISTKQYLSHALNEYVLSSWFLLTLSTLFATGEFPEWWQYAIAPFSNLIAWLPLINQIPSAITYNKSVLNTPASEPLDRVLKAGKSVSKFVSGDKEFIDTLWDLGRASEPFTGVPASNTAKDAYRIYELITGEEN